MISPWFGGTGGKYVVLGTRRNTWIRSDSLMTVIRAERSVILFLGSHFSGGWIGSDFNVETIGVLEE